MKNGKAGTGQPGQASVEYALLLVILVVIIVVALAVLGALIANRLGTINSALQNKPDIPSTPTPLSNSQILGDMQARIQAFYDSHGHWPRTFSPYNFTDIGLDPNDWNKPINGLYWSPHGSEVGIANKPGDSINVYVKDMNGNTLSLYNGWSIWCPVGNSNCYYHTVTAGNEVGFNSIYVTGQ